MAWIYLSPHLDDAVYSCGGLLWEQTRIGENVGVWTVCAGNPPPGPISPYAQSLHDRWKTGLEVLETRRMEDRQACQLVGASYVHFPVPDCIYRRDPLTGSYLYDREELIFGSLNPAEAGLAPALAKDLKKRLPEDTHLVVPLTIGGHVDHQLVRAAAEQIGIRPWYYADYPYAADGVQALEDLRKEGWQVESFPVSEQGVAAWVQGVAAYGSQISTFWSSYEDLEAAIRRYTERMEGVSLWRPEAG